MAKRKRLPKRLFGVKLPNRLRTDPSVAALLSPAGQALIVYLLYQAAKAVAGRKRHDDSVVAILARHPGAAVELGRWKARRTGRKLLKKLRSAGDRMIAPVRADPGAKKPKRTGVVRRADRVA